MTKAKSKPTASTVAETSEPSVTEYVVKNGRQGVFSHSSRGVAEAHKAQLEMEAHKQGAVIPYSLHERTVTYERLQEDHPQYDAKDPLKIPTGESAINHRGDVKEKRLS